MKSTRTSLQTRRRSRFVKKIDRLLTKTLLVRRENNPDILAVVRDGEIYFLTPNDKIPFYYDFYSKSN